MTAVTTTAGAPALSEFTGARTLLGFVLRRDRSSFLLWILILIAVPVFNVFSLEALLPSQEARDAFAASSDQNPITYALLGPIYDTSLAGIVAWRSSAQGVLVAGLASILMVIRHTRAEEEAGRRELISSTAIGRQAGLAAALGAVIAGNIVSGLLLSVVLTFGNGFPFAGSLAYGLVLALGGCFFGAAAALVAQLAQTAALTRGMAIGVLGVSLLPGVIGTEGDSGWLSWFSAIGWTRFIRAYAGEQWYVLAIPLAGTVLLAAVAFALSARRDMGTGKLIDRGTFGPRVAAPSLRSPLALAAKLHRETLTGWIITIAVISASIGFVSSSFDQRMGDLGFIREYLAGMHSQNVNDAFLAIFTFVLLMLVGTITVGMTLKPYAEESAGYAGNLLATPTSRVSWLGSHLVLVIAGSSVLLLLAGVGTGAMYALTTGRSGMFGHQVAAMALALPAVWFVAGVTALLYALVPQRAQALGWGFAVLLIVLVMVGEAGIISRGVFVFTPYGYNHPMMDPGPAVPLVFTVLAAALTAAALAVFRRRDLLA